MLDLLTAARTFIESQNLVQMLEEHEWLPMFDDHGRKLEGIRGKMGASGLTSEGVEIGLDLIEMDAGTAFPLHTHPGDHVLYVLEGIGAVWIAGRQYAVYSGASIFIPADLPHGVAAANREGMRFLAVGIPHKHVSSEERMTVVQEE